MFSIYITIVRAKTIRKLIKDGAYDVRNSPLDRMSSIIARVLACSKGVCEAGGTVGGAIAGLYTVDNLMRDLGYEPNFVPFIRRNFTNSSEADADTGVECDNKNKIDIDMDQLKLVQNKLKTATEEEALWQDFYNSKFITKDEWMELQGEFQHRLTVLDENKQALLKQIKENLKKGYGAFEGAIEHGLKDNYPTSSKVLEALNSKLVREDLFPKTPGEAPNTRKFIEALKDSGKLKEDTFSANTEAKPTKSLIERLIDIDKSNSSNKDSIGDNKGLTGSESETVSQSSNTDKDTNTTTK